jgi:hypothetical protein
VEHIKFSIKKMMKFTLMSSVWKIKFYLC